MVRVLDVTALKAAGIEFSEEVITIEELKMENPQARILTQYLLDFKHIISYERWMELDRTAKKGLSQTEVENIVIPECYPDKDERHTYREYVERYDIDRCETIFDQASTIKRKVDQVLSEDEQRWSEISVLYIFNKLINKARNGEGKVYKQRALSALSRFRAEKEHTWYAGRTLLREHCQETHFELKAPKPDLYFCFHAYVQGDTECGPLSGDDYIENFSMTRLSQLKEQYPNLVRHHKGRQFGFYPSPCTKFYDLNSLKSRTCFPWAVCEWKHQGAVGTRDEIYLHCQAANAAAICLTMFANAATGGRPAPVIDEIRPVVCMTLAGAKSKVWVAYVTEIKDGRYKYRMRCIWKGDLSIIVDNIKLCVVIENLHFWAMNHLRPWLSSCVDQWRRSIAEVENAEVIDSDSEDSGSSSNFAFRRANTLDDLLNQDEGSDDDDDDSNDESSEEEDDDEWEDEDEEEEEEEGEEEEGEEEEGEGIAELRQEELVANAGHKLDFMRITTSSL
ncbi:hypothetical protein BCR34DRAFT_668413 [Clohesyomyces aquaticus]|uniref:Uncharacterized protein n=1 Tax=Clohesyomyces aquaticus TaxID=1231657 RepID=A0A1Y1YNX9_9PLEO|nr:hypothetical protein BCR34DRAFT_668413 [Clohesyomyces aquaticus]